MGSREYEVRELSDGRENVLIESKVLNALLIGKYAATEFSW